MMSLPLLDAMTPAFAKGAAPGVPKRMVAINVDLGFMPEEFFPKEAGQGYKLSPYLKMVEKFRDQFTVFSGLSHPEVDGGHQAEVSFLTGAPHPLSAGFKNWISLDQYAARQLGHLTRFPTLNLRVGPGNGSLAYTSDGVRIPSEMRPSRVYQQLFVQGTPAEVEAQVRRLKEGQSLMDSFAGRIKKLQRGVSGADKERLDQFFTSVREVEERLVINEEWEQKPKPKVAIKQPKDDLTPGALVKRSRNMFDLVRLALETDSTRLVTVLISQNFNPKVDLPGVNVPHHALTHQTQKRETREQLAIVEKAQMSELGNLLAGLNATKEDGETLLKRTMVMQGSNLGHANRHDNRNLPILLAGGHFKHGSHLAFDEINNMPLANLYLSMLQQMGVEADKFSTATGTLQGLEMTG